MPRTLSNWEYRQLVSECQDLVGRRLEKIYEPQEGLFRLDFAFGDSLVVKLGEYLYRTKAPPTAPPSPSAYAMLVRKYLEGRKLASFEAHPNDRIYTLKFVDAGSLVFEQFAGGNMFLLDTGGKIVRPYHFKQSEKKRYTAGQQYQYPASEPFQLPADMAGWRAKAAEKPNATLSALLARWPVGKCYTNEVLTRLGWKEKKAGEVSETEAGLLRTELEKVMNHPSFCVYEDEQGHMLEVSLTTLHAQALAAAKTFPTFSEAVEYYFSQAKAIEAPHESPELVKMRKRLSEQEGALEKLEGELAQGGPQTAWIEENLAGLEERREKINAGKKGGEKVEKHRWWIESG